MPMLSDKIGRRPTDMLLFAVSAGLSVGFAFAQGWWVVALLCGAHLLLLGPCGGAACSLHRPCSASPMQG